MPAAAVPALTLSVDVPPALTLLGFSEALAPDGAPLTVRLMVSAVPLTTAVEIVEVPPVFWARLSEEGFELMEKSFAGGGAVTVSITVVECVAEGAVPVTVSV